MSSQQVLCPVEAQYRPPYGYYDFPFSYVYEYFQPVSIAVDPRAGLDFYGQQVHVDGDAEFLMRKCVRYMIDSTDSFQLYSPNKNGMFSAPVSGPTQSVFVLAPEREYPRNGSITFDILNWASSDFLDFDEGLGVYFMEVIFQGVKRYQGDWINPRPSSYPYREERFCYRYDLTVDWTYLAPTNTGGGNPYSNLDVADPRSYSFRVEDYDFELLRVSVIRQSGSGPNTFEIVDNINSPSFRIMLYDPERREYFSAPVFVANINQAFGPAVDREMPGWPAPPMLYPKNSTIRFDVYSMLDDPTQANPPAAQQFQLVFDGVRRMPV